jgi:hypothetical protein
VNEHDRECLDRALSVGFARNGDILEECWTVALHLAQCMAELRADLPNETVDAAPLLHLAPPDRSARARAHPLFQLVLPLR